MAFGVVWWLVVLSSSSSFPSFVFPVSLFPILPPFFGWRGMEEKRREDFCE